MLIEYSDCVDCQKENTDERDDADTTGTAETRRGNPQRSSLTAIQADRHSDEIDEAAWSADLSVAVQRIEADWQERRQIQVSRDRTRAGHYGLCDTCGHPIEAARLAALPWAARCVGCQAGHERLRTAIPAPERLSMRDGFEQRYDDAA